MSVVGGAAGGEGEGAAGCNDKNKNPTIECGEKIQETSSNMFQTSSPNLEKSPHCDWDQNRAP